MKSEIARRQSNAEKVLALFRARPTTWIDWQEFAELVGVRAYRTRVSDARKIVEAEGGTIETRDKRGITGLERDEEHTPAVLYLGFTTQYRFLPYVPIARAAETRIAPPTALPLFPDLHPGGWQR